MRKARALIRRLDLLPHPEGGFYREVHRSRETVDTDRGPRSGITAIYFLLIKGQRSLFHRVASDEIWNFYAGDPLRLLRLSPTQKDKEILTLGPLGGRRVPVGIIPRGHWQAAEPLGGFALVGCSVGPGFDFADFILMRDDGKAAAKLRSRHPDLLRFL